MARTTKNRVPFNEIEGIASTNV
ncbi:unnamed protein product, partial [Rotaria sp. Silwood1]